LFDLQRREIVTAQVEPTDADCEWPSDEEDLAVRTYILFVPCAFFTYPCLLHLSDILLIFVHPSIWLLHLFDWSEQLLQLD
jgi:hypothetical protein